MNKIFLTVVLTTVLAIFIGTYFVEDLSTPEMVAEKIDSAITKTVQNYPIKILRGYEVVSFEKVDRFGNPAYFTGIAVNCDNLGVCDSVRFTSIGLPKLGNARFEYVYSTNIYNIQWNLIRQ